MVILSSGASSPRLTFRGSRRRREGDGNYVSIGKANWFLKTDRAHKKAQRKNLIF